MMDKEVQDLMKSYDGVVRGINDSLFLARAASIAGVISAVQTVHVEHLKRAFTALELQKPEKERITFSQYLRSLAAAYEKADAEKLVMPET